MEIAYLKEDTAIRKSGIIIPEGTKLYVDLALNHDKDMAQVKFPKSHPKYGGLHTVVPKENLLLDMKSRFESIQQVSDVLNKALHGDNLGTYEIEILSRVFPKELATA